MWHVPYTSLWHCFANNKQSNRAKMFEMLWIFVSWVLFLTVLTLLLTVDVVHSYLLERWAKARVFLLLLWLLHFVGYCPKHSFLLCEFHQLFPIESYVWTMYNKQITLRSILTWGHHWILTYWHPEFGSILATSRLHNKTLQRIVIKRTNLAFDAGALLKLF